MDGAFFVLAGTTAGVPCGLQLIERLTQQAVGNHDGVSVVHEEVVKERLVKVSA